MRLALLIVFTWVCQAQIHVSACAPIDTYFAGGTCYTSPIGLPAGGPSYLARERYGFFSYAFPVLDGQYSVTLHFIENSTAITGTGQRQFSVSINGATVLTGFDLATVAPLNTPVDRSFPVTVAGGTGIVIAFATQIRNAVVSAIDVVPAAQTPTYLSGPFASAPSGACPPGMTFFATTDTADLLFCAPGLNWTLLTVLKTSVTAAAPGAVLGLKLQQVYTGNGAGLRAVQDSAGTLYWLVDQAGNK